MNIYHGQLPRIEAASFIVAGIAVLVGVILAFVTSPTEAVIIGLLVHIVLETLRSSYKEREYELRFSALARIPRGPDLTSKLAHVGAAVRESSHGEVLGRELQLRIAEFESHLDQLGRGRIVREGADIQDLLQHTRNAKSDIRATTTVRADSLHARTDWWHSPMGLEYWELNRLALAKQIAVSRIFIVDVISDRVIELLEEHRSTGVDVMYARTDSIPIGLRANIIVWDSSVAWRAQMDTVGQISQNRIYTHPSDVTQLEAMYNACRVRATAWTEEMAGLWRSTSHSSLEPAADGGPPEDERQDHEA